MWGIITFRNHNMGHNRHTKSEKKTSILCRAAKLTCDWIRDEIQGELMWLSRGRGNIHQPRGVCTLKNQKTLHLHKLVEWLHRWFGSNLEIGVASLLPIYWNLRRCRRGYPRHSLIFKSNEGKGVIQSGCTFERYQKELAERLQSTFEARKLHSRMMRREGSSSSTPPSLSRSHDQESHAAMKSQHFQKRWSSSSHEFADYWDPRQVRWSAKPHQHAPGERIRCTLAPSDDHKRKTNTCELIDEKEAKLFDSRFLRIAHFRKAIEELRPGFFLSKCSNHMSKLSLDMRYRF